MPPPQKNARYRSQSRMGCVPAQNPRSLSYGKQHVQPQHGVKTIFLENRRAADGRIIIDKHTKYPILLRSGHVYKKVEPGTSNPNLEQSQCSNSIDAIDDLEENTPTTKELEDPMPEMIQDPAPQAMLGSPQKGLDKAIVSIFPSNANIENNIAGKQSKEAKEADGMQKERAEKVNNVEALFDYNLTSHIEKGVQTHCKNYSKEKNEKRSRVLFFRGSPKYKEEGP